VQNVNKILLLWLCAAFMPVNAMDLRGEQPTQYEVYQPTKAGVMKTLDKMKVRYTIDSDGDLIYTLNEKGWIGYIIFSYAAGDTALWSLQIRTQFATKSTHYKDLVEFANDWNANQKLPKISMKSRSKMVLSMHYPVQYGFNPSEFKYNLFAMFNRSAEKIGQQINDMRR